MSSETDLIAARELAALASENVRLQERVAALEARLNKFARVDEGEGT